MRRWQCTDTHYNNFGHTCWEVFGVHYAISGQEVGVWNLAVQQGNSTINASPPHLKPRPAKKSKAATDVVATPINPHPSTSVFVGAFPSPQPPAYSPYIQPSTEAYRVQQSSASHRQS